MWFVFRRVASISANSGHILSIKKDNYSCLWYVYVIILKLSVSIMKQELKEEWLTRTRRLIIWYAPSAIAQDTQGAYEEQYLFYYVCQKLRFGDALWSFHWATSNKNINRNFSFCKKRKLRNYNPQWKVARLNLSPGNPSPMHNLLYREIQ